MFQPYRGGFPNPAADALHAEAFAGEFFGSFNIGPSDDVETLAAGEAGNDLHVAAAKGCGESGGGAAVGDLRVARNERCDLRRVASHPDDFRFDAVLAKEILPLRNPERD